MNKIAEVTEKKRNVESCIKNLKPGILRVISFFAILCKKKELIFELDCALRKANDELKNS